MATTAAASMPHRLQLRQTARLSALPPQADPSTARLSCCLPQLEDWLSLKLSCVQGFQFLPAAALALEHLVRCDEIPQRPVGHESLVLQALIGHGAELAALEPGGDCRALVAEAILQMNSSDEMVTSYFAG